MDTLTQMALGACIGQAIGYKKYGWKATFFGAVAGGFPDIDVLWAASIGEYGTWKYHRHITHSLWIAPILGTIAGWGLWKHYAREMNDTQGHAWTWIAIMTFGLWSHPFLDYFTIYGTQLLAPFSNQRFEVSGVSIIDPIYTFILIFGMLVTAFAVTCKYARVAASVALVLSTAYLLYGVHLNNKAERIAEAQLKEQNINFTKVEAFTTIFQPFLRRVVVSEVGSVRVGFVSTFAPKHIYWTCRKDIETPIKQAILATPDAQIFDWFSISHLGFEKGRIEGEYTITDMRYGVPGESVFGWWGQIYRVTTDASGAYTANYVTKSHVDRDASFEAIGNMFRATYGLPNTFLITEDVGCS